MSARLSPFDILGVEARFDLDLAALEKRYRELSRDAHPDAQRSVTGQRSAALGASIDLNAAYRTLKDDLARGHALLEARGVAMGGEERENDPGFLMEVMELREALGDARDAKDLGKVLVLATRVRGFYDHSKKALTAAFASSDHAIAKHHLGRLRYYRRFLDEVDVIQEENELA